VFVALTVDARLRTGALALGGVLADRRSDRHAPGYADDKL
jgi:hypothetical protein